MVLVRMPLVVCPLLFVPSDLGKIDWPLRVLRPIAALCEMRPLCQQRVMCEGKAKKDAPAAVVSCATCVSRAPPADTSRLALSGWDRPAWSLHVNLLPPISTFHCFWFLLYLSFYLCCERCVVCVWFCILNHLFVLFLLFLRIQYVWHGALVIRTTLLICLSSFFIYMLIILNFLRMCVYSCIHTSLLFHIRTHLLPFSYVFFVSCSILIPMFLFTFFFFQNLIDTCVAVSIDVIIPLLIS